jgi:uncharacterized protein
LGVTQDYKEAIKLFRLSAEQGEASAQNNLGSIYMVGKGIAINNKEAMKWYLLSAEQGYLNAQNNLGLMYEEGNGIEKDYIHAHMWFNIGSASGDDQSRLNRDRIEKKMKTLQVLEAQKLARDWMIQYQKIK